MCDSCVYVPDGGPSFESRGCQGSAAVGVSPVPPPERPPAAPRGPLPAQDHQPEPHVRRGAHLQAGLLRLQLQQRLRAAVRRALLRPAPQQNHFHLQPPGGRQGSHLAVPRPEDMAGVRVLRVRLLRGRAPGDGSSLDVVVGGPAVVHVHHRHQRLLRLHLRHLRGHHRVPAAATAREGQGQPPSGGYVLSPSSEIHGKRSERRLEAKARGKDSQRERRRGSSVQEEAKEGPRILGGSRRRA